MTDPSDVDSDEDEEVATAEWTWGKAPVSRQWGKEKKDVYDFDVKKADRIFDLLLEKKQLRLPANHVIPLAKELKGKKYCKSTMPPLIILVSAESSVYIFRRP